jgi:hypothetical protein
LRVLSFFVSTNFEFRERYPPEGPYKYRTLKVIPTPKSNSGAERPMQRHLSAMMLFNQLKTNRISFSAFQGEHRFQSVMGKVYQEINCRL